nr:unnamed protein product [Callosobruchus analis]
MYKQAYNDVRNVYNKMLVDSRKEHFRNRIVNSDNKTKCVWNIIREIKGHPNDTNVLIPGNSESIANAYNHYILNTTNHLMSKIPYVPSMNINLGNDVEFQLVDNTKFLGVYVDETLRWTSHEILLFVFKNRQCFQKFLPTNHYPTRNFNYRFPVHHLTLTEKNVEYSCIKIFNHLPLDLKIVTDLTTFKKKIHKILYFAELFCNKDLLLLLLFNSKNRLAKYKYKRPLSQSNKVETLLYLEKIRSYILNLKVGGELVTKCPRKTGFLGFLISIENPLTGHATTLFKLLLKKYFTLRIHYECMKNLDSNTMRVRSSLTKTILFKNQ